MSPVVIENPILNSPFEEPQRHFRFSDEGITSDVDAGRRASAYFIPIAQPKTKGSKQRELDADRPREVVKPNVLVNRVRDRVRHWREGGYVGVTHTTRRLLEYWTAPNRERKLFFCQIESLETAVYILEVAAKYGDAWIENEVRRANETSNPGLLRYAFKMATGSGKTVVMAMIVAWHTLNKVANPQDRRFSDAFLIVAPGVTIRDRLRVLLPSDPQNYYRERDLVPPDLVEKLPQAKIVVTNFHTFQPREKTEASKLAKSILRTDGTSAFVEEPDEVARRVCRDLGTKKNIVVLNDEAHHCYRGKPVDLDEEGPLVGDDRKEAERRDEEARVWISGVEWVKAKIGVRAVYDLSATPFFLRGSGWPEGTLFPWVVSDFSLIDAIEAGIVKTPRVPVGDDSMTGEQPAYRDLWLRIREELPRKGRKTEAAAAEPKLPLELQGALHSLYSNYEKYYRLWEKAAGGPSGTPPVFIVVCNNTNVSKLVFDYISGWEKPIEDRVVVQAGKLPVFRNDDGRGGWLHRPNTILVDSEQLESGGAMSDEFKKIAEREIEEFKAEYRLRFPGRSADDLSDSDLLREVMNTVGKAGKLGENVKCVVSVSMLTEGWDANTVTHVLGVRAFGTQLLCEQVVGRALRRRSYAADENGRFTPEYAEVYGVPFSFIPCGGTEKEPKPRAVPTRVRALESRIAYEITFPRLVGYRYEISGERLDAKFTEDSHLALSTADVPTQTEMSPIVGRSEQHTLEDLLRRRPNEIAFELAKLVLEKYFRTSAGADRPWLFPQLLRIVKAWMIQCLTLKDNAFPQMLLLQQLAHDASDRIYNAIVQASEGTPALSAVLRPYDTVGSTRYVDFDTTRPVYATRSDLCHVSHVVADTESWEQKTAQALEDGVLPVLRYVKNHNLGFTIPYNFEGDERQYHPDFVVVLDDGRGQADPLNLILEVTGEKKKDKAAKVHTARTLWIPAVNAHGGFGRWAFLEVADPWDVQNLIRGFLAQQAEAAALSTTEAKGR